jgi:hypothetical protein
MNFAKNHLFLKYFSLSLVCISKRLEELRSSSIDLCGEAAAL